ncbi:MAG TPA: hypothetical protein VH599_10755 [Ktedonobacterales bacterium]|jgi:hypothetical protein
MTYSTLGNGADSKPVTINQALRREGLYIIGMSGSGKSGLLENLILQDINQDLGICVLEPHRRTGENNNDLTLRVIERMEYERQHADKQKKRERMQRRLAEDVIFLDIRDPTYVFGVNLFHCENPADPLQQEDTAERVLHVLAKVYDITPKTPQMYQYFLNITRTLLYNPQSSVQQIPRLLSDGAFRQHLLANVPDGHVQWFWEQFERKSKLRRDDDVSAVVNKLDDLFRPALKDIFGQLTPTVRLPDIMDQGKILLIRLDSQWESVTSLVGSIIISQVLHAVYARGNSTSQRFQKFNLYADEFQRFASEDFATLFAEARKYGIALTVAHQVLEQLDPAIKATCKAAANIVVMRVSPDNAKEIAATFDCSPQPGPPRYEPQRAPISEPIQFLLMHGAHPGHATRQFIDGYGKLLVDKVKREERAVQEYQRARDRAEYDPMVSRQVLFRDPPSSLFQHTLSALNRLFYEAMLAGKVGQNPDDIPFPDELLDDFIRAMVPQARKYLDTLDEYLSLTDETVDVSDLAPRIEKLQHKLAAFPDYRQQKLLPRLQEIETTQAKLPDVMRDYLRAEVSAVRDLFYIVRRHWIYYIGSPNYYCDGTPADPLYNVVDHYRENTGGPAAAERDLTPTKLFKYGSPPFYSWDAAVSYLWQQLQAHQVWFHAENSVGDQHWWQRQRTRVRCGGFDPRHLSPQQKDQTNLSRRLDWSSIDPYHYGDSSRIEKLNVWVLRPGVEETWYSPSMLEEEVKKRVEHVEEKLGGWYDRSPHEEEVKKHVNDPGIDYLEKELIQSSPWIMSRIRDQISNLDKVTRAIDSGKIQLQEDSNFLSLEIREETKRIEHEFRLAQIIEHQRSSYETRVIELEAFLQQVMRELAEAPVEDWNGMVQPVPTELSSSEVEARIANQLKQLGRFRARVRTTEGEATISTLPPAGGISQQDLLALVDEIKQRNLQAGYLQLRSDVEREIASRQQEPPDEPPPPLTRPPSPSSPPPAPMQRRKKVV